MTPKERSQAFRDFVDAPPKHAAPIVFMFRQATARRAQLAEKAQALRAELVGVERDLLVSRVTESTLADVVCQLADLTPEER